MNTCNDIHEKNLTVLNELKKINPEKHDFYKEKLLIKEAVKRGFKEGVRFIDAGFAGQKEKCSGSVIKLYEFSNDETSLQFGELNGLIFKNGNWATIIENPIPKELQSLIDKHGKEEIIKMLK